MKRTSFLLASVMVLSLAGARAAQAQDPQYYPFFAAWKHTNKDLVRYGSDYPYAVGVYSGFDVASFAGVGRFDNDPYPDIMGMKPNGDLYLWRGSPTGTYFLGSIFLGTGFNWMGTGTQVYGPGDIDGDGKMDMIVGYIASGWSISICAFRGNGTGGFLNQWCEPISTSNWVSNDYQMTLITPGDFDGDGKVDLITIDQDSTQSPDGRIYLHKGDGHGNFNNSTSIKTFIYGNYGFFAPGDIDGDGKRDIVYYQAAGAGNMWAWRGNGTGGFYSNEVSLGYGWNYWDVIQPW